MKESIQEILEELGFSEDQTNGCFYKDKLKIPFEALSGHSLETFLKMAHGRGWVVKEEVRRVLNPQEREKAKKEDQGLILSPCEECGGSGWDRHTNSGCISCLGSGLIWKTSPKAQ